MSLSKRTRFEVLKRDDFTCQYCGRKPPEVVLHVDHILARAEGGSDEMHNLTSACQDCNLGKSSQPLNRTIARADLASMTDQLAQVRAYREEADAWAIYVSVQQNAVTDYWRDQWEPGPISWPYPNSVRAWIREFEVAEIIDAIDKAVAKCGDDGSLAAVRYLAGIMRHKLAQAKGEEEPPDWAGDPLEPVLQLVRELVCGSHEGACVWDAYTLDIKPRIRTLVDDDPSAYEAATRRVAAVLDCYCVKCAEAVAV